MFLILLKEYRPLFFLCTNKIRPKTGTGGEIERGKTNKGISSISFSLLSAEHSGEPLGDRSQRAGF